MNSQIRSLIKRSLPRRAIETLRPLRNLPRTLEKQRTQRIFAGATASPPSLDINALATLQMKYHRRPERGYDADTLENRGMARAAQILRFPEALKATDFLELGCWDGMVSCCLCRKGKKAT